jgi:two-component system, chemotaxis family, protein-glutamate methylesterase/glutaminase
VEEDRISVLVVDDSALMRNLISRIVENTPGFRLAGTAMNGHFALQKMTRLDPDVLVLDLEMPEMNGIEFLKERRRLGIEVPVIILSSIAKKGAQITMEALSLGASDFIMKPSGSDSPDLHTISAMLIDMLGAYGRQHRQARARTRPAIPAAAPKAASPAETARAAGAAPAPAQARQAGKTTPLREPGPVEIIAIGISTGGPNALREVFAGLAADLPAPILVVQHMPAGFTEEFARSLDRICALEVKEAAEGDIVQPGRVLIAPGNRHMTVEKRALAAVIRLNDNPAVNGHRPSADVLFESVGAQYGNRAMAVIMTGMGRDGAQRIGDIYREGGITLGQDEDSSIVYGMPKVAWENGFVRQQLPLSRMAEAINRLARENRS